MNINNKIIEAILKALRESLSDIDDDSKFNMKKTGNGGISKFVKIDLAINDIIEKRLFSLGFNSKMNVNYDIVDDTNIRVTYSFMHSPTLLHDLMLIKIIDANTIDIFVLAFELSRLDDISNSIFVCMHKELCKVNATPRNIYVTYNESDVNDSDTYKDTIFFDNVETPEMMANLLYVIVDNNYTILKNISNKVSLTITTDILQDTDNDINKVIMLYKHLTNMNFCTNIRPIVFNWSYTSYIKIYELNDPLINKKAEDMGLKLTNKVYLEYVKYKKFSKIDTVVSNLIKDLVRSRTKEKYNMFIIIIALIYFEKTLMIYPSDNMLNDALPAGSEKANKIIYHLAGAYLISLPIVAEDALAALKWICTNGIKDLNVAWAKLNKVKSISWAN